MAEMDSAPSRGKLILAGAVIMLVGTGLVTERYLSGSFASRTNQTEEVTLREIPVQQKKEDMPKWATE